MGSATNTLHHRKSGNNDKTPSTSGHTPEHRGHLALEESLKLLNEANISNPEFDHLNVPILNPVVDLTDGTDDYVAVKPDSSGYASMKADLDDIDVPELAKFGIGGVIGPIWHEVSVDGKPPVKTWFC